MTAANRRAAAIAAAAIVTVTVLAGCAGSESGGSRVHLYHSIHELAAESAAIVEGEVTSQRTASDLKNSSAVFTISTVTVTAAPKGSGLSAGSTVEVRQEGDSTHVGPAPFLKNGSSYLLYLTPSGLPGPLATQYYVTGGTAGIYEAEATSHTGTSAESPANAFTHVPADEGDTLPAAVDLSDAQG